MEDIILNLEYFLDSKGRKNFRLICIDMDEPKEKMLADRLDPDILLQGWHFGIDIFEVEVFKKVIKPSWVKKHTDVKFSWRQRSYFGAWNNSDISSIKEQLRSRVESIRIGDDYDEYYLKMRSVMVHYAREVGKEDFYMDGGYNCPYYKESIPFTTKVVSTQIVRNERNRGEVNLNCLVEVGKEKIFFEVKGITPGALFAPTFSHGEYIPPIVLIFHNNLDELKQYVIDSINNFQASSILELKLKLAVFTNSLEKEDLVSKRVHKDLKYRLKVNYI